MVLLRFLHDNDHPSHVERCCQMQEEVWRSLDTLRERGAVPVHSCKLFIISLTGSSTR